MNILEGYINIIRWGKDIQACPKIHPTVDAAKESAYGTVPPYYSNQIEIIGEPVYIRLEYEEVQGKLQGIKGHGEEKDATDRGIS